MTIPPNPRTLSVPASQDAIALPRPRVIARAPASGCSSGGLSRDAIAGPHNDIAVQRLAREGGAKRRPTRPAVCNGRLASHPYDWGRSFTRVRAHRLHARG